MGSNTIYVMTNCHYFTYGLKSLTENMSEQLVFITNPAEIAIDYTVPINIVLVLEMSSSESLKQFKNAIDFLSGINHRKRIGVIVSRLNSYLTYYINRKLRGKVTFFNSHNLRTGVFIHNFCSWMSGKTFNSMRTVARFKDTSYGFTLREWLSLVVPLSSETIGEMAKCLGIKEHTLYQTRQKALTKVGIKSYREFCENYINGEIKIENETIKRIYEENHRQVL